MTNVWAYRVGTFAPRGGEWTCSFYFTTLAHLVDQLKKWNIPKGSVDKLGIVVHGDTGGLLQLQEGDVTAATIGKCRKDLLEIREYLSQHARVIFYSCIAGFGKAGSALLNELSAKYFWDRHVIGFEMFGVISRNTTNSPGEMRCSTSAVAFDGSYNECQPTATVTPVSDPRRKVEQILSEYSIYAKWSYHGAIIKIPYLETLQDTEFAARVVTGPEAVEGLLKLPKEELDKIEYIAIKTTGKPSREIQRLYSLVQEPPYAFKWGGSSGRLRELSRSELAKLPVVHGKAEVPEIVAFYKKKVVRKFKCAYVYCPSHQRVQDYCDIIVKHIPNGPLE